MVRWIACGIGAGIGWYLGSCDNLILTLLIFMGADYSTGVLCAVLQHRLSSKIGFRGILKKILILILVGVAHSMDRYIMGENSVLRTAVIFFYLSNEGISLLENVAYMGLPIPQKLKSVFMQLNESEEKE